MAKWAGVDVGTERGEESLRQALAKIRHYLLGVNSTCTPLFSPIAEIEFGKLTQELSGVPCANRDWLPSALFRPVHATGIPRDRAELVVKPILAAPTSSTDIAYRHGSPTIDQVRAHNLAHGGFWIDEQGTRTVAPYLYLRVHEEKIVGRWMAKMGDPGEDITPMLGYSIRPIDRQGTPVPWPATVAKPEYWVPTEDEVRAHEVRGGWWEALKATNDRESMRLRVHEGQPQIAWTDPPSQVWSTRWDDTDWKYRPIPMPANAREILPRLYAEEDASQQAIGGAYHMPSQEEVREHEVHGGWWEGLSLSGELHFVRLRMKDSREEMAFSLPKSVGDRWIAGFSDASDWKFRPCPPPANAAELMPKLHAAGEDYRSLLRVAAAIPKNITVYDNTAYSGTALNEGVPMENPKTTPQYNKSADVQPEPAKPISRNRRAIDVALVRSPVELTLDEAHALIVKWALGTVENKAHRPIIRDWLEKHLRSEYGKATLGILVGNLAPPAAEYLGRSPELVGRIADEFLNRSYTTAMVQGGKDLLKLGGPLARMGMRLFGKLFDRVERAEQMRVLASGTSSSAVSELGLGVGVGKVDA